MSKLTLNVDQHIIDAAKAYARSHKTSLSKLVSTFLAELVERPHDEFFTKLHQELLQEGFQELPSDIDPLRRRHVSRKYA